MYGVGQGLERGVSMATNTILQAMQMKQRDKYLEQQKEMYYDQLAARQGWQMGQLGPSSEEAEQAETMAAPLPRVPSSQPIETPGKLGVPLSRFEVGSPVARGLMPAAPLKPTIDSPAALLAFPPITRWPRLRTGY